MDTLLAARSVYKTYHLGRVDVPVLRGVSLEVRVGEWVAVLGASGSGKSTLLHLLGGLDRPDASPAGSVEFGGAPLSALTGAGLDRYRARSVGFVFQFYHLLPELTVLENVMIAGMVRLGARFRRERTAVRERAAGLLDAFGLGARLRHRPAELSGGERQRVAIARALVNDPPVLLADEPTGNLDRVTGSAIMDLLERERDRAPEGRRRTVVLVTHDREIAARADRVLTLVDGRFTEAGA